MIKYNDKDIIPRIDGKEISRVMYNGKQIWPNYKYEDIEFINVNNLLLNSYVEKLDHSILPENCIITKARIQVSVKITAASHGGFYIALYKSFDDFVNDTGWKDGSWFNLFAFGNTRINDKAYRVNYSGGNSSNGIMCVKIGFTDINSDTVETTGHDLKCSYDFELTRASEDPSYYYSGFINKIQEVDFEDLTTGKKYTNQIGNYFNNCPIFGIDNSANIYIGHDTDNQVIETLKIILTAKTIV